MFRIRRAFLLGVLFTFGMSFSFAKTSLSADDLSGAWSGSWQSCETRHHGPMSACFEKCGETSYKAHFKGRFFKVFPFQYSVVLNVVEESPEKTVLAGSSYLGRLFGTFYYRAEVTGDCFRATYSSCKDNGTWTLKRNSCCN